MLLDATLTLLCDATPRRYSETLLWRYSDATLTLLWRYSDATLTQIWRYSDATLTLLWRYSDATLTLLWRYSDATLTLIWRYSDATLTLLWRYSDATLTLLWRYSDDTLTLLWRYSDASLMLHCWRKLLKLFTPTILVFFFESDFLVNFADHCGNLSVWGMGAIRGFFVQLPRHGWGGYDGGSPGVGNRWWWSLRTAPISEKEG
jgi:hypothetical protein